MGTLYPSPELTLDFNPTFIPRSITQFFRQLSRIGSVSEKLLQVNDFVDRLESETRKIEAFKRQLPLCMLIVNDALVTLKEEAMVLKKSSNAQPVLKEFIPLKNRCNDDDNDTKAEIITNQKDNGDKKNWLSSTYLWNTYGNLDQKANPIPQKNEKKSEKEDVGRAIVQEDNRLVSCFAPNVQPNIQIGSTLFEPPQEHTFRKQRRCWSTELHRRFVNALQQLGGSQATPKQIRELMQVDGLTNDEVKSHLQKYRLHTRKIPSLKTNQPRTCSPDGPLLNSENKIDDEEEKSENYFWTDKHKGYFGRNNVVKGFDDDACDCLCFKGIACFTI